METLKWVGNDNSCFAVMFVLDVGKVKKKREALPGVVQWIGCRPMDQKVIGLIPSQGTCLGCGPGTQ